MNGAALLDHATVERALEIAAGGPILVAISGGGDSTALLHLLADQLGPARLIAVAVDHGLREAAAAEAAGACAAAGARGVAAGVVRLAWPDGPGRAQQTAREARYEALCAEARRAGARVIALGHTRDDQAETVLLRAIAKSGWRGLAGMRPLVPAPVWPAGRGLVLARPLLGARREQLRADLRARAAAWIEDPSNQNPAYARVRARARLAELEAEGAEPMRLADLAARIRPLVDKLDREAWALIGAAARFEAGRILIELGRWQGGVEPRRRALAALLAAAAGSAREPSPAAVARLETAMTAADFRGAALGGAAVAPAARGLQIGRDRGAVLGRAGVAPAPETPLEPGQETVWDGRLALTAHAPGWSAGPGASPDAPVFRNGADILALEAAQAAGAVSAAWLLEPHVRHLLCVHSPLRAPVA